MGFKQAFLCVLFSVTLHDGSSFRGLAGSMVRHDFLAFLLPLTGKQERPESRDEYHILGLAEYPVILTTHPLGELYKLNQ